jgi:hypothetical protein
MSLNKCLATLVIAAIGALATSGCVGTACDKAAVHNDQCFDSKSSGSSGTTADPPDCSGSVECQANCYNQYNCSVIKDFRAGRSAGKPLADCLTQCGAPTSS